jgi:3-methylfumaryl-CoA hydratase
VEEQDIVYRGETKGLISQPTPSLAAAHQKADVVRTVFADAVQLFRFSALTFNAHRIHYDRHYNHVVEGYDGLVVHGPYQAILLMDHFLRAAPDRRIVHFSFTARQPLLDKQPFDLCLAWTEDGANLWTRNALGQPAMTAEIAAP